MKTFAEIEEIVAAITISLGSSAVGGSGCSQMFMATSIRKVRVAVEEHMHSLSVSSCPHCLNPWINEPRKSG
ncbi:hypothetical protein AOQ84DRAFT_58693 [Glonium stellatum]|uniref:Uncharacterized protein n=1 Tax=Glonium stellatum TaxID=574774 RepID=A0A8E2JS71_9PEZI|nr:hypothetical protein AOQ84DRAFT_58693 [Glonium stellatum]